MRKKHSILMGLGLASSLAVAGCSNDASPDNQMNPPGGMNPPPMGQPPDNTGPTGDSSGGFAFNHYDRIGDPFADGKQVSPAEAVRLHSCGKIRYATLGKVLASRGVNLADAAADSAGDLYRSGTLTLGVANFAALLAEPDRNTTGGIVRLYDILIAAADEIIANMPRSAACKGAELFDKNNQCSEDGFSCLLGYPASAAQLSTCNDMINDFKNDVPTGKRLAVAAIAASNFLCD